MIKVIYLNESFVFIDTSESIFYELREYFSFFADGYQFNPKFKYGSWSGKIYLLDNQRQLPLGLVDQLKKFASNSGYELDIDSRIYQKEELSKEDYQTWLDKFEIYSGEKRITPTWYQHEAIFKGITDKKRILNLPTSAGKSLIQALLAKYYTETFEGNILILVPTIALTLQMKDDFIDYRLFNSKDIGILGGKFRDTSSKIIVSTWQSAIKQPEKWFHQFGMLLVDECHLATGKSISSLTQGLVNCQYKIGLSGSLKDGKANLLQYIGLFGAVYKPVSTAQLMEEGHVTDLKINCLFLKYPDAIKEKTKGFPYSEEIKVITKFKKRNTVIAKLAIKLAANENVFLMFKHIEHGKQLVEILKSLGHENVHYVSGEVSGEDRDILKKLAETQTGMIVVASYGVFSTGISVKNLHHVILAHPVKSKVIVLQTIGRVLRKHESKSKAVVWDIIDDMSSTKETKSGPKRVNVNYALKHGIERIKRYSEEKFEYVMKNVEIK